MTHPTEEQLILHYYGEDPEMPVSDHLAGCETCRAEYRNLQRILNTVESLPVPERPAEYGAAVWSRLRAAGLRPGGGFWTRFLHRPFLKFALAAAVVVLAFLAGRYAQTPRPQGPATASTPVRERILLVAVGDHLERSQFVLAEVRNADPARDTAFEQRSAADLVQSNRLFRLAANRNGDTVTAALLEELERTLLEIANDPDNVSTENVGDMLFKVRVYTSNVRTRTTGKTL